MNATDGKYVIIYGWMRELDLTLTETMAYALVYGYAKNGEAFMGSITYMQQWLRCTRHTAIKAMQALEDKGLLRKEQVIVKGSPNNRYYITEVSTSAKNALVGSAEIALEVVQPLHQGSAKNALGVVQKLHYNNNKDNNNIISSSSKTHAHAYEEVLNWICDNEEGLEIMLLRNGLISSKTPLEEMREIIRHYVKEYYEQQQMNGGDDIQRRGRRDIKQHFSQWLPIRIKKLQQEQTQKLKDYETNTDPITKAMQQLAAGMESARLRKEQSDERL
jgi:hypothetical protein